MSVYKHYELPDNIPALNSANTTLKVFTAALEDYKKAKGPVRFMALFVE